MFPLASPLHSQGLQFTAKEGSLWNIYNFRERERECEREREIVVLKPKHYSEIIKN